MSSYEEDIVTDDEKFIKSFACSLIGCAGCAGILIIAASFGAGLWVGSWLW